MSLKPGRKKIIWGVVIVILAVAIGFWAMKRKSEKKAADPTVKVGRLDIVEKALAVGAIEPLNEIAVKSKISGVVGRLFVEVGDYVQGGSPLLEVRPDPTPIELAEAKRSVEMQSIELANLRKEMERQKQLKERGLISDQEYENQYRGLEESVLRHQIAVEKLELLEKGKVRIAETNIEAVIKAPISGFVLNKSVNVGDPVVPLTSYQAGTELMKMADMKKLIFRGTVDEIDVGKIAEGLATELQIGALPGKTVKGHVTLISLKAKKEDNTTVFPIEISIDDTGGAVLRAGFSANASIIIKKLEKVLSIPERVVTFRNDSAFVMIPTTPGQSKEKYIKTGLSDAINVQVLEGLEENQEVLEKKVKPIV
jgi:HlyD family secretion protein